LVRDVLLRLRVSHIAQEHESAIDDLVADIQANLRPHGRSTTPRLS
jgi:hypothetical protein